MGTINMVDPSTGEVHSVPDDAVSSAVRAGWHPETTQQATNRAAQAGIAERSTGVGETLQTIKQGALRGVSLGGSDVAQRLLGSEEDTRRSRELKEHNSLAAGLSEVLGGVGGAVTNVGPASLASRAGSAITGSAKGASALARGAAATVGGMAEGAIYGAGNAISDAALSDDPVSVERIMSTIGSSALLGGGVGLAGFGAGAALRKAKGALDGMAEKAAVGEVDDVAKKALADDVAAFRKQTIEDQLFLPVKGHAEREIKTIAKIHLEADKAIDRTLRNPKALAAKPDRVLSALQQQEHAFEQILSKSDDLTARFAADATGERLAALQKIPAALERNRALQSQIAQVAATKAETGGALSLAQNMLGGQAFGMASSLVGAIPFVGAIPGVAQLAGSVASKFVTGGIGKALTSQAARMSSAIDSLLTVGAKVAPIAPVLATKTLSSVSFGTSDTKRPAPAKTTAPAPTKKEGPKLADLHKTRTSEIKALTQYDPTGRAVMRPEARAKIYDGLAGVRAIAPILADRLETLAASRIEYAANTIPRKPDVMATLMGADKWQPSDLQMRTHARVIAALEDPTGVVERLAHGTVTPAEAKAFRAVYPEMFRDVQSRIMSKLPTLQRSLPYQKRLALSIFTGVPVDPSMDPRILSVLQGSFAAEPAPQVPQPAFGSVKNHEATPNEARQGVSS